MQELRYTLKTNKDDDVNRAKQLLTAVANIIKINNDLDTKANASDLNKLNEYTKYLPKFEDH